MRRICAAVVLAMSSIVSLPALAAPTTYHLAITGQRHDLCINLCGPVDIDEYSPWTGSVSLTAPSELDGTFSPAAFEVDDDGFFQFSSEDLGMWFVPLPPSFTVAGGLVTDAELNAIAPDGGGFSLVGMTAGGGFSAVITAGGASVTFNGILTNVPEPETYGLMLGGLAFGVVRTRRRRR